MIDHLLGRPSAAWKRTQVVLVLLFWCWRLRTGDKKGPAVLRRLHGPMSRLTPWQLSVTLLTMLYGLRHWDTLLGLGAPEPLARLYSKGYYRATWVNTALDAGFATAAPIPIKWMRDVMSMLFAGYYLIYANEADEKLRRYRAVPTVEMMRVTWEKTTNPIIRFATRRDRPKIPVRRRVILPRPPGSKYTKPVACWLFFARPETDLAKCKDLVLDIPGGGFIAMSPLHHEERLIRWAIKTNRPVLSLEYCKAPEYPFPFALDECVDIYRLIQETKGRVLGMGRDRVDVVLTGDSAGANLGAAMLITILEAEPSSPLRGLPLPASTLWMYPAFDFNFTSWMDPANLRVLCHDKSVVGLPESILEAKNHLQHKSPLSVVDDRIQSGRCPAEAGETSRGRKRRGLNTSFSKLPGVISGLSKAISPGAARARSVAEAEADVDSANGIDATSSRQQERDKSLGERVLYHTDKDTEQIIRAVDGRSEVGEAEDEGAEGKGKGRSREDLKSARKTFGTRLTMTSRTSYFNDRVITPSMMRSMAICYIGPRNAPDLTKDYYISPIFAPASVLARFPPVALFCGEKDPFVDDTVLIAGKIKEAKRARRQEVINAKRGRYAERLRTGTAKAKDPIVDETDEDWVQMRIFEGWSHGFAQMMALLPEATSAIDLMAGFITAALTKHDEKLRALQPRSASVVNALGLAIDTSAGKAAEDGDEEILTFVPRRRGTRDSDSQVASPASAILAPRLSSSPTNLKATPGTSSSGEHPTSSLASPASSAGVGSGQGRRSGYFPKDKASFANAASASATTAAPGSDTCSPAPKSTSRELSPVRKEGHIIDGSAILHRRREDTGIGIPIPTSPDGYFKDFHHEMLLPQEDTEAARKASDSALKGQFVGEHDLYERRRQDAAFGLPNVDEHEH